MNSGFKFAALTALGLIASAPVFAQVVAEPDGDVGTVATRDIRVLPFDVSRKLKIARTPLPPVPLIVGTYCPARITTVTTFAESSWSCARMTRVSASRCR